MGAYQDCCTRVIERFEGHVAKFLGDGVLAYFGYPQAHEDDAERAIRAGLDLVDAIGRLSLAVPLAARVGISTGEVVAGDLVGERSAEQQAVVGETPNRAARLQALAEPGSVVIGPHTRALVGRLFDYADLGAHEIKGFSEPIQVSRVLGPSAVADRFAALRSGAADAAGRPRARDRPPARALGAGAPGRGPRRAADRRARHRQVTRRPEPCASGWRIAPTGCCATSACPTTATAPSSR